MSVSTASNHYWTGDLSATETEKKFKCVCEHMCVCVYQNGEKISLYSGYYYLELLQTNIINKKMLVSCLAITST